MRVGVLQTMIVTDLIVFLDRMMISYASEDLSSGIDMLSPGSSFQYNKTQQHSLAPANPRTGELVVKLETRDNALFRNLCGLILTPIGFPNWLQRQRG